MSLGNSRKSEKATIDAKRPNQKRNDHSQPSRYGRDYAMNDLQWYALLTKARHEKTVRDQLIKNGIQQFLPTIRRTSQWKDRKTQVEVPLFACYCFAWFQWQDRLTVLNVPGVLQIVGGGHRPESIPEEEIAAVRAVASGPLPYYGHPYLKEGTRVGVIRGPLQGVTGILICNRRPYRLVISINLLQQAVSVEIDADDVAPIEQSVGHTLHSYSAAV